MASSLYHKLKTFIPKPYDKDDDAWASLWRGALSEFFAVMIFVFIGCGSVLAVGVRAFGRSDPTSAENDVAIALAHGFAIMVLVYAIGEVSGGHINPAVTWATMITGKISIVRFVVYWIAQILGSIAGASAIKTIAPPSFEGNFRFIVHSINPSYGGPGLAFLAEVYFTFIFVFVVFATAISPFAGKMAPLSSGETGPGKLTPFAVGATILILHLVGIPITGASMNPARSFGPAVMAGAWDNHWLYWLGPLIGSSLAAFVSEILFLSRPDILYRIYSVENAPNQTQNTNSVTNKDYAIMKEEELSERS
eukprot:TRINITY_DN922_c0_g1_i1.p1 TRINITY_DN922_c0_g1~~TRINITY_DN922_c0_g1_i1.p1  ORF type:complete len:308 (+),score=68.58 TRINITY_DN922_c0_g1_i1:216-1139(+)